MALFLGLQDKAVDLTVMFKVHAYGVYTVCMCRCVLCIYDAPVALTGIVCWCRFHKALQSIVS
jgi:hypothetical protein